MLTAPPRIPSISFSDFVRAHELPPLCAICQEAMVRPCKEGALGEGLAKLACNGGHAFHSRCLGAHLAHDVSRRKTCPVCRVPIDHTRIEQCRAESSEEFLNRCPGLSSPSPTTVADVPEDLTLPPVQNAFRKRYREDLDWVRDVQNSTSRLQRALGATMTERDILKNEYGQVFTMIAKHLTGLTTDDDAEREVDLSDVEQEIDRFRDIDDQTFESLARKHLRTPITYEAFNSAFQPSPPQPKRGGREQKNKGRGKRQTRRRRTRAATRVKRTRRRQRSYHRPYQRPYHH